MQHGRDGSDLIIVSDLHISAADSDAATASPDTAFACFLDSLCRRAISEGRRWRLLILGDLCDLLRTELGCRHQAGLRSDTSADAALTKLERISEAHPGLFAALGDFVSAGFSVDIVPGNHDVELIRGSAQERFKALVVRYSGRPEAASGISFHPWIYYVPGVLYAEHGHQYHDINAFATLLRPYRAECPGEIALPLGSSFDRYLARIREAMPSASDTGRSACRTRHRVSPVRRLAAPRAVRHHAGFLRVLLHSAAELSTVARHARRATYQEEVLRSYAVGLGLGYGTVLAIDQLSLSLTSAGLLLRRMLGKAAGAALRRARQPSDYLVRASLAIHRILQAECKAVPYYVFGHTHAAEQVPITGGVLPARYLNTGSWAAVAPSPSAAEGPQLLTFVQVMRETDGGTPLAQLLRWNDGTGRSEPLLAPLKARPEPVPWSPEPLDVRAGGPGPAHRGSP